MEKNVKLIFVGMAANGEMLYKKENISNQEPQEPIASKTPSKPKLSKKESLIAEYKSKIIANKSVVRVMASFGKSSARLTGGAIVDILDGKEPKDLDIVNGTESDVEKLLSTGFALVSDSKTALTLKSKSGIIVQFLKTDIKNFKYTIEQASIGVNGDLDLDIKSYRSRILVPVSYDNHVQVMGALERIPHHEAKGFIIPPVTYQSLLNALKVKVFGKNTSPKES